MSKKERGYIHFIEDVANAIDKIEKYTRNLDYETFCENEMIIDAVVRNFEVIGEAMNNIPEKIMEKYPDVEWSEAVGFRNVLIHNYFGLDNEAVWDTIKKNIPGLKKHIEQALMSEMGNHET
ncbi:MAG: DUF86 domain-containing protein [Acidobacteria bacterium]|nr:DUF86 domain-containing protein [Acidobacteriota bacterium]